MRFVFLILFIAAAVPPVHADGEEPGRLETILREAFRPGMPNTREAWLKLEKLRQGLEGPPLFEGHHNRLRDRMAEVEIILGISPKVENHIWNRAFSVTPTEEGYEAKYLGITFKYGPETEIARPCTPDKRICIGQYIVGTMGAVHRVSGVFKHNLMVEFLNLVPQSSVKMVSLPNCRMAGAWLHDESRRFGDDTIRHYQSGADSYKVSEDNRTATRYIGHVEACFPDGTYAIYRSVLSPLGGPHLKLVRETLDGYREFAGYKCTGNGCFYNGEFPAVVENETKIDAAVYTDGEEVKTTAKGDRLRPGVKTTPKTSRLKKTPTQQSAETLE